jgi:hypothetical protein
MVLGSGIWDPGSGKNLFRIPDPGVKKHPIPDPQHCIFSINSGTEHREGGGSREPRTAIELSFSAWGGLGKPNRDRGETFFPDSGSDRNSDETFQISRNLGLEHVELVCLLDSLLWLGIGPLSHWTIRVALMTATIEQQQFNAFLLILQPAYFFIYFIISYICWDIFTHLY